MEKILSFFVSNAYADVANTAPANAQGGGFSVMIMFAVLILATYFFILRPQSKRAKEQQAMLSSLAKGDEIITVGGLLGRVNKITDQYLILEVRNNIEVVVQKSAVGSILPKGTLKSLE